VTLGAHVPNRALDVPQHSPEPSCPCAPPPMGGHTGHERESAHPEIRTVPAEVRSALANAYRRVNFAFGRLPAATQDAMDIRYDELDRALDAALRNGDRDRALAAIRAWRDHWLGEIGKADGRR